MYEYALCLVLQSTFDMVIKQIELIITITTNTKFPLLGSLVRGSCHTFSPIDNMIFVIQDRKQTFLMRKKNRNFLKYFLTHT